MLAKITIINQNIWQPVKYQKKDICKSESFLIQYDLIYKHSSGIFSFTYMGNIIKSAIEEKLCEMMESIGYYRMLCTNLVPRALWNRPLLDEIFFHTNKGSSNINLLFNPTSEELIQDYYVNTNKKELKVYQISSNFRNEMRPQMGLYRSKNFYMKDAYGYFNNPEQAQQEFDIALKAYRQFFNMLNLEFQEYISAEDGYSLEILLKCYEIGKKQFNNEFLVEVANLFVLDYIPNGISLGIGISRLIQSIADISLKQYNSLFLPNYINPFEIVILAIENNEKIINYCKDLANNLVLLKPSISNQNINVFIDLSNNKLGDKIYNWEKINTRSIFIVKDINDILERKLDDVSMQYQETKLFV